MLIKPKSNILIKRSDRFGGIGLFSTRRLEKGFIIASWESLNENKFFTWKQFEKFDATTRETMQHFCAQVKEGIYAPEDINLLSLPWHMNHCCDGNVGFNLNGDFITIKLVKENTELCYDYGFVMSDPKYKLKCICKAKNCRKLITGNDWLDTKYQKNNFKYLSPEIREMLV
jgi:hypothetical protein